MKRKKTIKKMRVDAILTGDWHLREDNPVCRLDDFEEAQWRIVDQVSDLQKKYKCPVIHSGDLFHHWKPSPSLLSKTIEHLPNNFRTVYGNHDLPQHSLELAWKSGIYTLEKAGALELLDGGHWGEEPEEPNLLIPYFTTNDKTDRFIYVWHKFVYDGKPPFPGAEKEATGHWLLDEYPDFDLILTGDNHQAFVCKDDGRLLVNPGSLTRQTAGQINFRPRVYLYNSQRNVVKRHYLDCPDGSEVISREHIEKAEARDERISAFVEKLDSDFEADLDFKENLRRFQQENDIPVPVMDLVYKALDDG